MPLQLALRGGWSYQLPLKMTAFSKMAGVTSEPHVKMHLQRFAMHYRGDLIRSHLYPQKGTIAKKNRLCSSARRWISIA